MIDRKVLLELCDNDEALASHFIQAFVVEAAETPDQIGIALTNEDYEALGTIAHTLKSHFQYFGALEAVDLAASVERLSDEGASSQLTDQTSALVNTVNAILEELKPS